MVKAEIGVENSAVRTAARNDLAMVAPLSDGR
jgi:hypothetical protein